MDTDLVPDSDIGSVPDSEIDLVKDLCIDSVDLLHGFFCVSTPRGGVNIYFKWSNPAWASIGQ